MNPLVRLLDGRGIHVQGVVVVGERAEVDAAITASTMVIGGTARGNVTAAGRVGARDFHTSSGAPSLPERPADTLAASDGA